MIDGELSIDDKLHKTNLLMHFSKWARRALHSKLCDDHPVLSRASCRQTIKKKSSYGNLKQFDQTFISSVVKEINRFI